MTTAYFEAKLQELIAYPENCFGETASERWLSMCSSLGIYQAASTIFSIEKNRKWELVSALQKAIRRADKATALKLISGMANMPEEYGYFWRRICVIACEDVGPADDTLAKFVVACATLFARKRTTTPENYRLWCFLAEQMCDLPSRSRVYCSYSILDLAITRAELPELTAANRRIIDAISEQRSKVLLADSPWLAWQKTNDWRTEGLLRFVGMTAPTQLTAEESPLPRFKMMFDLPSYCYDVHTRVGLEMLRHLVRGVPGAEGLREFFNRHRTKNAHRALGDALFFVEGGRIQGELVDGPLCSLEQRFFAYQYRLPLQEWWELRFLIQTAVENGFVDSVREEVLERYYGQRKLQLIAEMDPPSTHTTN